MIKMKVADPSIALKNRFSSWKNTLPAAIEDKPRITKDAETPAIGDLKLIKFTSMNTEKATAAISRAHANLSILANLLLREVTCDTPDSLKGGSLAFEVSLVSCIHHLNLT
jgi:hypothetical protein